MASGLLAALVVVAGSVWQAEAKSYGSGGGHSYSSQSSSHSSSYGGSHAFSSGGGSKSYHSSSGKSYSSGSSSSSDSHRGYSSAKSYSAGSGHSFSSVFDSTRGGGGLSSAHRTTVGSSSSGWNFDTAAAKARKEETSRADFSRFKDRQRPPAADASHIPAPVSTGVNSYRPRVYIPDAGTLATRRVRIYQVFTPYAARPWVVYRDPYSSFFWWWLLDRTIDDQAYWAYHHRYDMDPARYQALLANNAQLEARVEQLEAQQAPRDPNYAPTGLDRDLMYSDQYVARAYTNRPTVGGKAAFWLLGIPAAVVTTAFFIWLIWFKRW
ncbi:exported hypothetical protein [Verrucomicrobia bacterium]|nr:exported hypothetical protein [Verrucomicrobiota bacterium]